MARVRIVKLPKALSGLEVKMTPGLYGTNGNTQFNRSAHLEAGKISQRPTEVRNTLQPVARDGANLEAERGETAVIDVDGMPAHFKIGGKRHSQGGTPLNLPDNSFIFSDTAKMKIKDPTILAQFGMKPQKGGYTPAEISKKYDINKFRKVLADPNSEDMDRKTAEMMIANYNLKLAKLSLAQESIKGFPQGIPVIAMPYIESMEIDPSIFMGDQAQGQLEQGTQPDAEMGTSRFGGGLPKAQAGWANQIPRDGRAYSVADLKKQAKAKTVPFSVELANKKQAAKTLAQENEEAYYADLQDAETDAQMNALYNQYAKVQERVAAGDSESDLGDYIPFVPNSAEKELEKFKAMARAQGKNPDLLEKQIVTGVNIGADPRTANEPTINTTGPINQWKTGLSPVKGIQKTADLKKAVETGVKNWLHPTRAEIEKLSDDELMYLNRIHKRYKVKGYSYGGSTSLTQYKEKGEVQPTAADIRKKYLEDADKAAGVTTVVTDPAKPATGGGKKAGTTSGGKVKQADGTYLTPEEEAERIKRAGTVNDGIVTAEQYAELERLYKEAEASSYDNGKYNPNKKTDQNLAFQKYYHSIPALKKVAEQIIAEEKDPTNKGKTLAKGQRYDVTANEDSMFGPRTMKYWDKIKKAASKEEPKKDGTVAKKDTAETDRGAVERNPAHPVNQGDYAPWWLQDIVKTTGAANDLMRVKKYLPWQATPEVRLPDATFYDPTRELAANAEQANIQTQGMGAFMGPQALSARSSSIQGQALKNAADIQSRYNNMNVEIANKLNQERTSIMNTASQNKAGLDTQLFDKYTIANQQFDNSKNLARQNLRQSYIDAITNKAKTQALNSLYPNFYTDPSRGGYVNHTGYAAINPTKGGADRLDKIQKVMDRFPGTKFEEAAKHVDKYSEDSSEETASANNKTYLNSQGYS
jgi:hypothetical protein